MNINSKLSAQKPPKFLGMKEYKLKVDNNKLPFTVLLYFYAVQGGLLLVFMFIWISHFKASYFHSELHKKGWIQIGKYLDDR